MSNIFTEIGTGIEKGAEAVGEGVKDAVEFAVVHPIEACIKTIEVLETVVKDSPAVKTAISGLITAGALAEGETVSAIEAKGLNVPLDIQAVTDDKAFFVYFKNTFIPAILAVYNDLKTDVTAPAPATVPAVDAAPAEAEEAK